MSGKLLSARTTQPVLPTFGVWQVTVETDNTWRSWLNSPVRTITSVMTSSSVRTAALISEAEWS